ncbi:hypothetical protein K435DRAFT_595104, partial [Dendrothele bispora CBS 962.96]
RQTLDEEEYTTLVWNVEHMHHDVNQRYHAVLQQSHHGRPLLVENVVIGVQGRPRTEIHPNFLGFAYQHRSTSGIARFLQVGRRTVRRRLLELGIAQPGQNPLLHSEELDGSHEGPEDAANSLDDLLDPIGLIRWGIVIHGFIDGYSRLVTGLRASNNNYADTVLHLFLQA